MSGAELREYTLDSAQSKIDGLQSLPLLGRDAVVIEGWSTLLVSPPRCGKTELLAHACIPWLRQGKTIVWFSEEPESTWVDRREELLSRFGSAAPISRLTIVYAIGADPRVMLDRALDGDEDIVIADTLRHAAGIEDENDAASVRRSVGPWVGGINRAGKTLIAAAHHRKQDSGDAITAVAGSHALAALFDVILELRPDHSGEGRRRLSGTGRRIEIPTLVLGRDEEGRMYVLGDGRSVTARETQDQCRDAVIAAGEPLTTTMVWKALGRDAPTLRTVQRALDRLCRQGVICREPGIDQDVERRKVTWFPALKTATHPQATPVADREIEYCDTATETTSTRRVDVLTQAPSARVAHASGLPPGWLEADDQRRRALIHAGKQRLELSRRRRR